MPALRLLLCGLVIAAVTPTALSQPDPPGKELPFAGPPPPKELQVLAPLVGEWTTKLEARPSLQDREGYTAAGRLTGRWVHNGHFLRMEGTNAGSKYRGEVTTLYGYDARRQVYRRWLFSSNGLATESEGRWDEAKKTMTWRPRDTAPTVTGVVTDVFAEGRVESTVLYKREDGQVLADVTMIATRKKER